MVTDKLAVFTVSGLARHGSVGLIQPNLRHGLLIEFGNPAALTLGHHHIRNHVLGTALDHAVAGSGFQLLDQGQHVSELFFLQFGFTLQGTIVPVAEQIHVLIDHLAGLVQPGGVGGKMLQLNAQAFLYAAGGDADRVEMLNALQYRFHLVRFDFLFATGDGEQNILQILGQIAGVIDGVDNGQGDGLIGLTERSQMHLP